MATAYVTLGPVETRDVFNGKSARSETITTSGTAASGALIATVGDIAQVFCVTAVYARSGSPATGATSVFCPGGVSTFIRMTSGDVVSLIDA